MRGTLVHAVLDRLFDLPAGERAVPAAHALIEPEWARLREEEPAVGEMFSSPEELADWLASAKDLVSSYFQVERPDLLEPSERELGVEVTVGSGLRLRGIIDRLDVAPTGHIRVVDYKTGTAPREAFEVKALFQLKFYALVVWRTRGVVPAKLRLVYLADQEILDYTPHEAELAAFERTVIALHAAIERCFRAREFPASPSKLCGWCPHQALCPAHGGNLPPFPEFAVGTERSIGVPEAHTRGAGHDPESIR